MDERNLGKIYDDLQKEQNKIILDIRTGCSLTKESENTRQIQLINTISMNILKLLNLKKKIKERYQ